MIIGEKMADRDAHGRFLPGHKSRGGRPKSYGDILEAMASVVTPAKAKQVAERALKDAIKGDKAARAWLFSYLLGKPPEFINQVVDMVGVMTLTDWREQAAERRKEVEDKC